MTLTELPNLEMSSFDTPATTSHAKLFSWEEEWGEFGCNCTKQLIKERAIKMDLQ